MSIGHSNVHSSNGRTEMSIRHSNVHFVQWTNGHCRMLNTSVSYPQGVMLDRITSLQQFWHCKRKMSIGQTEMSIGYSYVHSSSGRTEMSIGHKYISIRPLDEQKCPLGIQISIRPLDEWTNGHCLMATTLVSYPHGVRLSQITSLQLPCTVNVTCPLDINKCPFVHWTNRNVHWTLICPFVHWTNRNVHWTFKCPFVQWTNGHCRMLNTSVS